MKGSGFLILIGVVVTLTSICVIWGGTQIIATQRDHYIWKGLYVHPKGYSYQVITFYPHWDTHFSFRVTGTTLSHGQMEGGVIKYLLLESDDFDKWSKGNLSPEWMGAPYDFSCWTYGISGAMSVNNTEVPHPTMYYVFYNEDSRGKSICFRSFKSQHEITTNYFYMVGGFLLLAVGTGTSIFGLYKRLRFNRVYTVSP